MDFVLVIKHDNMMLMPNERETKRSEGSGLFFLKVYQAIS